MKTTEDRKYSVTITTPTCKVKHVVRAPSAEDAAARALRAHPEGRVIEIARAGGAA